MHRARTHEETTGGSFMVACGQLRADAGAFESGNDSEEAREVSYLSSKDLP